MPYILEAGRLNRRIRLQEFTISYDGDPTSGTWSSVATVWAERMDKQKAERFVTMADLTKAESVYRIRHRSDITPGWRIVHGELLWDVDSVAEGKGVNQELMILVTASSPVGDTAMTPLDPALDRLLWGEDGIQWGDDDLVWD